MMGRKVVMDVEGETTTATVRMSVKAKEAWHRLAEAEGRSMGNYLERLLDRAVSRDELTLPDILYQMLDKFDDLEGEVRRAVLKKKASKSEPSPFDIDTGEVVTQETWHSWLNHLRGMGMRLNHYAAMKHFEQLKEFYDCPEQWNCDELVKDLIKLAARSIYLPNSFKKS
jgi:hypothetical protein